MAKQEPLINAKKDIDLDVAKAEVERIEKETAAANAPPAEAAPAAEAGA